MAAIKSIYIMHASFEWCNIPLTHDNHSGEEERYKSVLTGRSGSSRFLSVLILEIHENSVTMLNLNVAGIPIEHVKDVFRVHWYWKRFFDDEDEDEGMKAQKEIIALLKQRKQRSKEHHRTPSGGHFPWPLHRGNDSEKATHRTGSGSSDNEGGDRTLSTEEWQNEHSNGDSDDNCKAETVMEHMKSPFETESNSLRSLLGSEGMPKITV